MLEFGVYPGRSRRAPSPLSDRPSVTLAGTVLRILQTPPVRSLARRAPVAGRALQLAAVILLAQSLFWTARVPFVLKLATAALGVLAYARPGEALLVVIGLLPFTYVLTTRVWDAHPLALAEALVLAFLAGYLTRSWRWRDTGRIRPDALSTPAWVLALVLLASCAVQATVVRVWHDYPLAYAWTFLTYLARDYLTTVPDGRPWVQGQSFVTVPALLLEGAGLLLAVRALCRARPGFDGRVLRVLVLAGAGAAVLTMADVADAAMRGVSVVSALSGKSRWTTFIPSLNTGGAYFVAIAFVAFGLAATWKPRAVPILAGALALLAMWLTKTSSAVLAAFGTATAGLVWLAAIRTGVLTSRKVAVLAALAALTVAVVVVALNPMGVLSERAYLSLHLRVLFADAALRMLGAHPLFGVGPAQYGLEFPRFASSELLGYYARAGAHDNFLWIAAEFGLVGLGAFLWLLGRALTQVWGRLRDDPRNLLVLGLAGAVMAFVLTWLSWQPLEVPIVAYTFWVLLGVASHPGAGADAARSLDQPGVVGTRWRRGALAVLVVLVVASVPFRARQAIEAVDFSRVTYGFHLWETEGLDTRYRWTGARATFFVPSTVRAVALPLRAPFDPTRLGEDAFEVRVFVNRQRVGLARLADDRWQQLRVPAPADAEHDRVWRVDLEVSPTWRPARLLPGSTDPRVLGVKVGEIRREESPGRVDPGASYDSRDR